MFWQFDNGFVSQIDALLDKETVSLQELMDEEDILQECKSQNQKLIQFITRGSVVEEMVTMITSEPPMDVNERMRYKYANIACEIMTSDVNVIIDALVSDDSMLSKLYGFVDREGPLNPLLSSFFSKVMGLLFVKKTEVVFEFLKSKDLISLLLTHIETSAVMDLILKLIVSVDNLDLRKTIIDWLHENDLIKKLLFILKTDCLPQRHINAAQLICDIIKTSREHQSLLQDKADKDLLLESLESTETVSQLLDHIFTTRTESSLVSGLSIIQSLLEYKRHCMNINTQHIPTLQTNVQNSEFEGMPQCYGQQMQNLNGCQQPTPLDTERLTQCIRQVEAAILPRLHEFSSLLENPPQQQPIITTVGVIEKPLGATRLEVAHLITALLNTNNQQISDKLLQMNTLPLLVNLFFEYPWNNFLHKQVEHTIACIVNNNCNSESNGNELPPDCDQPITSTNNVSALVKQLLTQCQLIERICDSFDDNNSSNNENQTEAKPIYTPPPGYQGHLVIIANLITNKCSTDLLQQLLSAETFEKWKTFVEQILSKINTTLNTPLVNEMPHSVAMDEESLRQQESTLQQAFIEYQMQQMTRNLCTQIAFAANEFTEHTQQKDKSLEFEKLCTERAKASLDSNSSDDEDLWEDREMTFTQTINAEHKLSVESAVFSDHSFHTFNSSTNQMNKLLNPMDVDQNDPWGSEESAAPMAPIPMETSNPWENLNANKMESQETITTSTSAMSSGIEADSWADFSSFSTIDFNSSIMSTSISNSLTTPTITSLSSSEAPIPTTDFPESTTCDEPLLTSEVGSSSSADSKSAANSSQDSAFVKNSSEDQENVVTSSTSDSITNGPNS
ncbi:unnamed protein product [Oppiella nova]|uniref:Serine/threonine-protein phosphatase 6 regulatory subunit 3 n=2 Tax=Oppiella nova TaxID=334625 RepID=A0A7R9MBA2_9ACAR|nr:unnamed protein product [Oppiella nova]CAG2174224.1 unnamed protein product [Oppiella nova]